MAEIRSETVLADRYVLRAVVDEGGTASVWRATDLVLDRPVAVKILDPHLAEESALRLRFVSQAEAAARVSGPNVVNVFDSGTQDGLAYIVLELFEGETLRQRLDRTGSVDPVTACHIVSQVLSALQLGHDSGLVHGAVNPSTILISPEGRVKLTGFTIAPAAPDERADLFACGATLYELLTGRPPFAGSTDAVTRGVPPDREPDPPRAIRPGIPRSLETVVMRALRPDPADRYASAQDMRLALSRLRLDGADSGPGGPGPAPPHPSSSRGGLFRSWMLVPLLAVLVAAAVIAVGILTGRLQTGGPLGIRLKPAAPATEALAAIPVRSIEAFDPFGDGALTDEHEELASAAIDGDRATSWMTENYDQLDLAPKPGVGLLLDLGDRRTVSRLVLETDTPGFRFEVRVGDDPEALADRPSGKTFTASATTRASIEPVRGRYVLVWITQVVGTSDGNRATVAELQVLGPRG